MSEPIVIHPEDVKHRVWPGGGEGRRMLEAVGSKKLLLSVVSADPGKSPHRWHKHTRDKGEGFEIIYPREFEEAYIIVRGKGTLYWKVGVEEKHAEVKEGDAVYFPFGVVENQLVNSGDEQLVIVAAGAPPVRVIK